jgi:hypothetical protein
MTESEPRQGARSALIIGVALLTTWLADQRRSSNLMLAGWFLVGLGILGFAARFDWLQRILPSAQVIWAVLFLVGGAYLVWKTVAQKQR